MKKERTLRKQRHPERHSQNPANLARACEGNSTKARETFAAVGPVPSNVIVNATKSATREDLKKQLMEMVKSRGLEYGVIVRTFVNNSLVYAFRIYPDGHEELIRKGSCPDLIRALSKSLPLYQINGRSTQSLSQFNKRLSSTSFRFRRRLWSHT